ncbi:SymE family type I addiction module toxin [Cupriavidus necator]
MPWIRLKGVWLETAGFTIGKLVEVVVQNGRIVVLAK